MAWTTPRTMITGTTGTVADWNTYIRDNENVLYNGFINATVLDVTASRLTGTTNIYQNTTAGALFCRIFINASSSNGGSNVAYSGSTSPPQTTTDAIAAVIDATKVAGANLTFLVRPNYYYTISVQPNSTLTRWWDYGITS